MSIWLKGASNEFGGIFWVKRGILKGNLEGVDKIGNNW